MGRILTVLLLLAAPALHAQAVPPGAAEQPAHLDQVAEPLAPRPTSEAAAPAAVLRQRATAEQSGAAAEPIFDRAFWRSVLAGVIASVLTAVILRVIL